MWFYANSFLALVALLRRDPREARRILGLLTNGDLLSLAEAAASLAALAIRSHRERSGTSLFT